MTHSILYHFPFDTGYVIGEDERVVSGIVSKIEQQSGEIFGRVAQKKVEIVRLEAPEDYAVPEYVPLRQPIVVELAQIIGIKIPIEGLCAEVAEADVSIFPMGIAIGHVKFRLEATKKIGPRDLYAMEAEIFKNCRALQIAWPESQLSIGLRRVIDVIRESVASFFAGSDLIPLSREPGPKVDYFYPLYYIDGDIASNEVKEFLCLLYMCPSNRFIAPEELERALRSNASIFSKAWLITGGEGAIMAGSEFSGAKGESYSRALEIVSYIWYAMFILDAYLSTQIKRILSNPVDQLNLRDAEEQLRRIRDARALVHDTLEEYRNTMVSLWASIIHVFDNMFEAMDIDRIERSVNGKLEILGDVYGDITGRIERNHNFEMNRAVYVLQRVGFALAAALGIIPLIMTAVRNTIYYRVVLWPYATLVEWVYPALGALIVVSTVIVASRIARSQWQRRSKETRFL